ncbi:hypothetical protein [Aureimonas mangrovi]|uniref:hypothetical protein n=1 Tax=Aureimonas mangrovi TaxID=2758041 RepID=UPI00163D7FA9|nr:hypothetical protein [Aureimonas mangrovi]
MTETSANASEQAKVFRGPDRAEKGSALGMIAAEAKAMHDKTARLRAQRLAREETEAAEAAALEAAKPAKKTPARRVRKTEAA